MQTNEAGHQYPRLASTIVASWVSVLATWLVWVMLSIPAFGVPRSGVGVSVLIASLGGFVIGARLVGASLSVRGGIAAGLVAGVTNMLILGADLADKREGAPSIIVAALGYLALSAALGAVGVFIASRAFGRKARAADAVGLAFVQTALLCTSLLALLLLGGAVTSTRSGLAVPDWPGSFGSNMFLLPFSRMSDPNVFAEHSHRLFGAMIGVTAIATFIVTLLTARLTRPVAVRWIGVVVAGGASIILLILTVSVPALSSLKIPAAALAAVAACGSVVLAIVTRGLQGCVAWMASVTILIGLQGYFGGSRVTEQSQTLAIIHGVLAHVIFAIVFAQCVRLSGSARGLDSSRLEGVSPRVRTICAALLHTTVLQVVLGAIYRHLKETSAKGAGHTLNTHILVSLVVVVLAIIAGFVLLRESRKAPPATRAMRLTGIGLIACVSLQFVLGWAAMVVVMMAPERGAPPTADQLAAETPSEQTKPVPAHEVVITLAHHTNGAILLGLCSGAVVLAKRLRRASEEPRPDQTGEGGDLPRGS